MAMIPDFYGRLKKRFNYRKKWAKKHQLSNFRIYHHDLPDVPAIIDWYDGALVCWIHPRTKDDTPDKVALFESQVKDTVSELFPDQPIYIKSRRIQKGLSQYEKTSSTSKTQWVKEGGLFFELNMTDYVDVGLFLDHRCTRQWVRDHSRGLHVLNLFSYTGSFSCYALDGGAASVISVDLNRRYLEWTQRNIDKNQLTGPHQSIHQDVRSFLSSTNQLFDLIICDPPTFSNSKQTKEGVLSINDDAESLLKLCLNRLSAQGQIIFSTNSKKFQSDSMISSLREALVPAVVEDKTEFFKSDDFNGFFSHRCLTIKV